MRFSRKLALGAAAGVVPFLVGQPWAAAATAQDDASIDNLIFTSTGGSTVQCDIRAEHTVDSDLGELDVSLVTDGNPPCRGNLSFEVKYVNGHGEAAVVTADAVGSHLHSSILDAGSTAVTVDHFVTFADCSENCSYTLQTKTK